VIYDNVGANDYTNSNTLEYMMGKAGRRTASATGVAECWLFYGDATIGGVSPQITAHGALLAWRDGDTVALTDNTGATTTFTFAWTITDAATQFNSKATLRALIDAMANFECDSGAAADEPDGLAYGYLRVRYASAGAVTTARLTVTTRSKTCGQVLGTETYSGGKTITASRFLGGGAAGEVTPIFTPLANEYTVPVAYGGSAAAVALAPYVSTANIYNGIGFEITHSAAAGTEKLAFAVPG
jgi:hypothetical protein